VISALSAKYAQRKNCIYLILMLPLSAVVLLPHILPNVENDKIFMQDQAFRAEVAALHKEQGGKILVLRGGEPGGDSQTRIKGYYYWDNVFFFGDLDEAFKGETPALAVIVCTLKLRGISMVFDPTKLSMVNHSGKFAYEGFTGMLDDNPTLFPKRIQRHDAYKGVVYGVEYTGIDLSEC
jgi:hypothetical protein